MRTKSKPVKEKPAADIAEVKRRFTRQNRDLARANSTQALHIQNLKHEVEKLVAQNQDLKEMILRLQGELGTSRSQASSVRVKIAELNGLVATLYAQADDGDLLSSQVIMSPTPRQFRERQPLAELMQETQMPTIAEHKSFPRRTLDGDDIFALRLSEHSSNGSPDLGPPPVAHFDRLEPIAYTNDHETTAEKIHEAVKKADDELLLASVETRRKRKDGPSKLEMRRSSILALSPAKPEADTASTMLRTGAKRKLADREAEKPQPSLDQDDFTFSRRSPVEEPPVDEGAAVKFSWPESTVASPSRPARRALGAKDVNISPRKATAARTNKSAKGNLPDLADVKKSRGENAVSSRKSRASITSQQQSPPRSRSKPALPSPPAEDAVVPSVHEIVLDDVEVPEASTSYPPKTPAAPDLDLFSPPSSQQLNIGSRASRDTPPPAEAGSSHTTLTTTSTENENAAARPSRRARSAVNYAEPSLVAKMRRPGKGMVDAISGLQDPRCVMSGEGRKSVGGTAIAAPTSASGTPASSASTTGAARRMVVIKTEPIDEDARDLYHRTDDLERKNGGLSGNEPGSPLNSKSTSSSTTSSALSDSCGPEAQASLSSTRLSSATNPAARRRRDSTQSGLKSSLNANIDDNEDVIEDAITLHNPRSRTITIPSSASRTSTKPSSTTLPAPPTILPSRSDSEALIAARKRAEELDLYDFKETSSSSPAEASLAGAGTSTSRGGSSGGDHHRRSSSSSSSSTAGLAARIMTKQHRRHSSVPKDLNSSSSAAPGEVVHSAAAGVELGAGKLAAAGGGDASLVGSGLVGNGIAGRAERVAARRRSMMI